MVGDRGDRYNACRAALQRGCEFSVVPVSPARGPQCGDRQSPCGATGARSCSVKSEFGAVKSEFGAVKSEFGAVKSEFGAVKSESKSESNNDDDATPCDCADVHKRAPPAHCHGGRAACLPPGTVSAQSSEKTTTFIYLSKSTSNAENSYSSRSIKVLENTRN